MKDISHSMAIIRMEHVGSVPGITINPRQGKIVVINVHQVPRILQKLV
jgi:hypothetical protein